MKLQFLNVLSLELNKLFNTEIYGYQFPKIIFNVKSDFSISYQDFRHKVT